MSEIDKMYRNAGVKQLPTCNNCNMLVEYWSNGTYCSTCRDDKDNNECGMADYIYPPFTAEKQLRLKTFIGLHYGFQMLKNEAFDYIIATRIFVKYEYEYKGYGYGYDEAIANLVNTLWQDLTEEEKQQVKGILE